MVLLLANMSSPTYEIDLQGVFPEDYSLPSTHVVRTVKDRYINARVLYDYLQEKWAGNATIDVRVLTHQNALSVVLGLILCRRN